MDIAALYLTFLGAGRLKYGGNLVVIVLSATAYYLISRHNQIGMVVFEASYSQLQLGFIIVSTALTAALVRAKRVPASMEELPVTESVSVFVALWSPFNTYSPVWILAGICIYLVLKELEIWKKMKKNLKKREKYLFFSYFINNITSVIAAITIHIVFGGYRALPFVGMYFDWN